MTRFVNKSKGFHEKKEGNENIEITEEEKITRRDKEELSYLQKKNTLEKNLVTYTNKQKCYYYYT